MILWQPVWSPALKRLLLIKPIIFLHDLASLIFQKKIKNRNEPAIQFEKAYKKIMSQLIMLAITTIFTWADLVNSS